jgi:hypothetical protein
MFPSKRISSMGKEIVNGNFCIGFDGTNEYITCGDTNDLSNKDFSIVTWVKASDLDSFYILSKKQGTNARWYFGATADNPPVLTYYSKKLSNGPAYTGSTSLDTYKAYWVHLVLTVDRSGNAVGYINSELDNTDSAGGSTTNIDNTGDLIIGAETSGAGHVTGKIFEIAIYASALTSNQVKTMYNGREPYNHKEGVAAPVLQAWWTMGDGTEQASGTKVYDMSVNSNGGTLTNMEEADFEVDVF